MATDTDMTKIAYSNMLKQLQHELNSIEARKAALQTAIAGLERLMLVDEQPDFHGLEVAPTPPNGQLAIPSDFFRGKTPTEAYRDLQKLWPGDYRPPQIANAFEAGGMVMGRTKLLQAIHSVVKRERDKVSRNGNGEH